MQESMRLKYEPASVPPQVGKISAWEANSTAATPSGDAVTAATKIRDLATDAQKSRDLATGATKSGDVAGRADADDTTRS